MVNLSKVDPFTMVDIAGKDIIRRTAVATGRIHLKGETIEAVRMSKVKKGDPLSIAEVASVLAVKRTPDLIPMCHNIPINSVDASFTIGESWIEARCRVDANARTGVEMEALTGVSVALLTIWDMVKYMEKDESGQYPSTKISDVRVLEKRKG